MKNERASLVVDICAWLRDLAESEPASPKAPVYREVADDIEERWKTGEFEIPR